MASNQSTVRPMAQQILAYLSRHPGAQDTVEGIAGWWLLEEKIWSSLTETQMVLDQLVEAKLVTKRTALDGKCYYRTAPKSKQMKKTQPPSQIDPERIIRRGTRVGKSIKKKK